MTKKKAPTPSREQQLDEGYQLDGQKALDTGAIEHVAFSRLAVSRLNVRKHGVEVGPEDELVASIRAHGLLQPLVGYAAPGDDGSVMICAGQRRLLALHHIARPDTPIPVRIVDRETAIEVSLAENLERKEMNPVDELDAFNALIETGHYDANRIADRFGFDRRYVRRRLKMAVLHPEILLALRDGAIGLSAAEAYAASDDRALQLATFKEQSRPNAWDAHAPRSILQTYACSGVLADSELGTFIGGVEAYEAEGGKVDRDDAFADLFAEHSGRPEIRLTDAAIVARLYERAQAAHQEEVEAMAREVYPFATAVEWCDAKGNSPKPDRKSGLVLLTVGYSADGYVDSDTVADLGRRVAEAGGQAIALARVIDGVGIVLGALLVTKATLDQVRPKPDPQRAAAGSPAMTDEQRAAIERERKVRAQMEKIYARSLIGETPGFGITHVNFSRYDDRLTMTLTRLEKGGEDIDFADQWNACIRAELLEPFRAAAEAKVDQVEAERVAAEQAEAAKADEARAEFDTVLAELEEKPIGEWPAIVAVSYDDAAHALTISRLEIDGEPALWLVDEMSEGWSSDDPAQTVEIIRDQSEGWNPTVETFDSAAAYAAEYAGRCRLCGCVEECACIDSEIDEDWSGPCSWADESRTLCNNPDCLTKAGAPLTAAAEPAEA